MILDRYVEGHVHRISPEAPVPVLLQTSERDVLGGAGNVASNILALGANCYLVGVIGRDDSGDRLCNLAREKGINIYPTIDDSRKSSLKTRLLGDRQQLLRVDSETLTDINAPIETDILNTINNIINEVDAIIVSDYRKGLLTTRILKQVIQLANVSETPIFVDPKGEDYTNYIGADYIKPNRSELQILTKMACNNGAEVEKAAAYLSDMTGSNVLVTLSQDGMLLYLKNGVKLTLQTEAIEVFDVSGAGDTAIASFVFALVQHAEPGNAARFANIASGIAVSKVGTAAVSFEEIENVIKRDFRQTENNRGQIVTKHSILDICQEWKKKGLIIGFTNGCFDLLHPGHIALLRSAAAECDRLIVGLNSDDSVVRLKGPSRPIQNEQARAEVLSAIECVDLVSIFSDDTPLELIKAINPDVLIKGSDYEEKDIVGADYVKSYGGKVFRVQLREGHSTTSLVKRTCLN